LFLISQYYIEFKTLNNLYTVYYLYGFSWKGSKYR